MIFLFAKTFEEYLKHLEQVFERLKKAGLTLKPEKCCFLRKEVLYFGHVISGKGIAPDPAKSMAILCQQISLSSDNFLDLRPITDVLFLDLQKLLIHCTN